MMNLEGKKWGELTEEQRTELLKKANPVDGSTGYKPTETMECIIDLEFPFSVPGKITISDEEETIEIADDAVIYNPTE